jgi:hypothetical protein
MHCAVPYCTALHCTHFYSFSLFFTLLYSILLYFTSAYSIILCRNYHRSTFFPLSYDATIRHATHFVSYDDIQFSSPRMMMQHWMSWQEIIAQAYLFEEKSIGKKKHNRSSSTPASPVQKRKKRFVSDLDSSLVSRTMLLR